MKKQITNQLAPAFVLLIISVVVTAALSGTYILTKPVIAANTAKAENAARTQVLAEAEGFSPYKGDLVADVIECSVSNNNVGIAVKATSQSYGGTLTAMVGINQEGEITGISVISHTDTPGLGSKVMEESYLKQYNGQKEFSADDIRKADNVDSITGATISSDAMYQLVKNAMKQYAEWEGAGR